MSDIQNITQSFSKPQPVALAIKGPEVPAHLTIYKRLLKLVPFLWELKPGDHAKSHSEGFMDLSLNVLDKDLSSITIALSHHYEQNGDLVSDPDMEIRVYDNGLAEALTFQDFMQFQRVYNNDFTKVNPELKKDLNDFLATWLKNCIEQGHRLVLQPD